MNIKYALGVKIALVAVMCLLFFLVALPVLVEAAPPLLPTRPLPTATATPTPTPTLTPTLTLTPESEPARGSAIVLQVQSTAADWHSLWTTVEWQDVDGAWRLVEGWQGAFDTIKGEVGYKTWSIPPSLFGQRPFRWVIYDQSGGAVLATSESFEMPRSAGQTITINITLDVALTPVLLPVSGGGEWGKLIVFCGLFILGAAFFLVGRKRVMA